VKLLVDLEGYQDGRLVQFEIWQRIGEAEEKLAEVNGVTKGGKGIGRWIPQVKRKEDLPLEEEINEEVKDESYYFIAKIDEQEVKSEDFVFTYALEIFLEDEWGEPIDGAEYTIKFSDGTEKKGSVKNGKVNFQNAPGGEFEIELKDYEFLF